MKAVSALKAYLKKHESAYALSKRLGVSRQVVSNWVRRANKPGRDRAVELEKLTGGAVRVEDWS